MKKIIFSLWLFSVLACSTPPVATLAPTPEIAVERSAESDDKMLTGRKFYLNEKKATQAASPALVEKVRSQIRARMKELGFEEVSLARKAHTSVLLYSDLLAEKNARFNLTLLRNQHGLRPMTYSYVTFTSPRPDWTGLEDTLLAMTEQEFKNMLGPAPEKDLAMKGDPACFPQFGYEYSGSTLTAVYPGSPAAVAGLKVGDVIEAIDSQPLSDSIDNLEMYASKAPVPVKIKRGDKTIRISMRAKMACE